MSGRANLRRPGLTHAETDVIMGCLRQLKARGVSIVLIEQVMRVLVGLSERVVILHHGEKIFEGSPGGLVDVYPGRAQRAAGAA